MCIGMHRMVLCVAGMCKLIDSDIVPVLVFGVAVPCKALCQPFNACPNPLFTGPSRTLYHDGDLSPKTQELSRNTNITNT